MNKVLKLLLAVLILVLFATGCQASPEALDKKNPTASKEGTQIGDRAPDFELWDINGETASLRDLIGKPVLLNFWATWCSPCRYEMPFLQEIFDEWAEKGLIMLAIDVGESSSKVKEFFQNYGYTLPVLLDSNGSIANKYEARFIPTTFFIDKNGIIQGIKIGPFQSKDEIEASINMIFE